VTINNPSLGDFTLNDKSILITGGTGTFGKALVKHIIENYQPRRLVIYSRDELKQYEMALQYSPTEYNFLRYFIGDIRDYDRLEMAFRDIDLIIHAAAMKHVTIAEYNPFECIHTNVLGAENIVRAAIRNQVERVVALSTDKAVNPINLYGASKLASDKIFVAANNFGGRIGTTFSVVRYGNVSGSRGSIIPYFQKLVEDNATEFPITDTRMTRFWITIEQGVNCALWTAANTRGGEIVIPKIPSFKVTDVAAAFSAKLPIKITGIRPGEKLHETLLTSHDARHTVETDDYYIVEPAVAANSFESTSTTWWHLSKTDAVKSTPLDDDSFDYASNTNTDWVGVPEIEEFLKS
jgi:UDP-N-acetylglucosamine 4,6-dehydratase/5-epimerase